MRHTTVEIAAAGGRGLAATISPLGAELTRLADADGADLLWHGDPAVWSGQAPVLFPIVGALASGAYTHQGQRHELARHGFARRQPFDLIAHDHHSATFRLLADSETAQAYPFDFALDLTYAIHGRRLDVMAEVRNEGSVAMPFSLGFHPALRWPLEPGQGREGHSIRFEGQAPDRHGRVDGEGLLFDAGPLALSEGALALADALFEADALVFTALSSRAVVYGGASGRQARVTFPDMPDLGIWTKPGAGYICIEPWQGHADPVGFAGEFTTKPGVLVLAPGVCWRGGWSVELSG